MRVEILGTGCPKCGMLTETVKEAVKELGVEMEVVKVTKIQEIMKYNVMMTPGLVIDGEVKSSGRIPSKAEITVWITAALVK